MKASVSIRFWGVRGSIPVPGAHTKEYGGNTSCVEIRMGAHQLIVDAGSGLRLLGEDAVSGKVRDMHLILSHYHLDHITGLPFFKPIYDPRYRITIYGPGGKPSEVKTILGQLFSKEFFPVPLDRLAAAIVYRPIARACLILGPFTIASMAINHPGTTLGFRISAGEKRIAYLSDHENINKVAHLGKTAHAGYLERLKAFLHGCDVLIHDAHFLRKDYGKHRGWGHSTWGDALSLSLKAGVGHLVLFHYAPEYVDKELRKAERGLKKITGMKVSLARESRTMEL